MFEKKRKICIKIKNFILFFGGYESINVSRNFLGISFENVFLDREKRNLCVKYIISKIFNERKSNFVISKETDNCLKTYMTTFLNEYKNVNVIFSDFSELKSEVLRLIDSDIRDSKLLLKDISKMKFTIERKKYFVIGENNNNIIILINAVGVSDEIWKKVIITLCVSYKVIFFDFDKSEIIYDLYDRVIYIEQVLKDEKISEASIICWCSGMKIALELYHRKKNAILNIISFAGNLVCYSNETNDISEYDTQVRYLGELDYDIASILEFNYRMFIDLDGGKRLKVKIGDPSFDARKMIFAPFSSKEKFKKYYGVYKQLMEYPIMERLNELEIPLYNVIALFDNISLKSYNLLARNTVNLYYEEELTLTSHVCIWDNREEVCEIIFKVLK